MNKLLICLLYLLAVNLNAATITNWGAQLPTAAPAGGDVILMQKGGVTYYFTPNQLAVNMATNATSVSPIITSSNNLYVIETARNAAVSNAVVALIGGGAATNFTVYASIAEMVSDSAAPTGTVAHVRGYYGTNAFGGGFFRKEASSDTTNLGTVFMPATGTRWIRIFSGPVNIQWFGADPLGVRDIKPQLDNAITSMTTGGELYFPRGIYNQGSQSLIIATTNLTITGDGMGATEIISTFNTHPSGASTSNAAAWRILQATNLAFRDFTIRGRGETDALAGYDLINFDTYTNANVRFDRVEFRWARHSGLRWVSSSHTFGASVNNCMFRDIGTSAQSQNSGGAIKWSHMYGLAVLGCEFRNNGNTDQHWSIYGDTAEDIRVNNNRFTYGPTGPSPIVLWLSKNVTVSGNTFVGTGAAQARSVFSGLTNVAMTGNTFTYARVSFRDSMGVVFEGNSMLQPSNAVECVELIQGAHEILIKGNIFRSDGLHNTSDYNYICAVHSDDTESDDVNNVSIVGNLCHEIGLASIKRGTNHYIAYNRVYAPSYRSGGHGAIRLMNNADATTQVLWNDVYVEPGASGGLAIGTENGTNFFNVVGNSLNGRATTVTNLSFTNQSVLNARTIGIGTDTPLGAFHVIGGIVQTNGGIWQHFSLGAPSAPAVGTQGAVYWNDGTNICYVARDSAGALSTNKLSKTAWP